MTTDRASISGGGPTERIGRYEVIRKIATGGMAELYLARFHGPGGFEKRCALKRILPQFASDEKFTRMFLNEARVTAMFDHPNLVQIFELGEDDKGQFFIAMELINGLNLRQLLHMCMEKGLIIPPELAAFMMAQALDGLAYAHEFKDPETGEPLNLVHRDISPQNILVSFEGAVKLVDFGIVKGASISSETQAGMLKGKVAYMSPEQASGEQIDARSDLFSLGVCFYELIAGERPFDAANDVMTLRAILEKTPLPITTFLPTCPLGIEQSIYKALEKYPEHRYNSAREFHVGLSNVLRECPIPLGRHVVGEFIASLTEQSTDTFDATRLSIPRVINGPAPALPNPQPYYPPGQEPNYSAPSFPAHASQGGHPGPPIPSSRTLEAGSFTPTPSRNSAVSAEALRAAGIKKRFSPGMLITVLLSAFVGAAVLWTVLRKDEVLIESVPVVDISKTPPKKPPKNVAAPLPPPKVPPTTPPVTPPVTETPPPEAVTPPPPLRTVAKGTLFLETTPRLIVRRGKRKLGRTPLRVRLRAGTHTLKLRSRSLGVSRKIKVSISEGQTTNRKLTLKKGTVKVLSRPYSEVYVGGVKKGTTPAEFELYEGSYNIRMVNPDKGERSQRVVVVPGQTHDIKMVF